MLRIVVYLVTAAFLLFPSPQAAVAQTGQERKAIKLDAGAYDAYVGQYELSPDFVITVRREGNGLSIQATGQPKIEVFAESETKFFLTAVDAQITFVKNEKGEVTHLILHQNGADQNAKRIISTSTAPPAGQSAGSTPGGVRSPVEVTVPIEPTPFKGDGKTHLAYELHLANFDSSAMTLTRLEVSGGDGKPLAKYEGEELKARLGRQSVQPVAYLWLTFDKPSAVPAVLHHSLTARSNAGAGQNDRPEIKIKDLEIKVRTGKQLVLSPPLRGDGWLAGNGPSNTSGHRRALIAAGGAEHIAQRFAIDWVQLREDGKTWVGDQLKNESYRAHGAEALAVADGTVVAVKDGIPENIPGATSRAVPITMETVGGNHVILDLGQGRYAFYAHLQPGSLRVKLGDKVKRGRVLGLVGNSGNSTEPHLHFHVSNKNSPLSSEGLPYVFDSFEVQGKGWGWKPSGKDSPVEKRTLEIPMQDSVVRLAVP